VTVEPQPVEIRDDTIRLGQLLKLADLVEDGGEAKDVLSAGQVRVNGEVETRRGRQLVAGDTVAFAGRLVVVARSLA
jgi:ribosome-associated protein